MKSTSLLRAQDSTHDRTQTSRPSRTTRRKLSRPRLESLEERVLLTTDWVTSNADTGAGSLRTVIANATAGDTIEFNMTDFTSPITLTGGVVTISKNLTIDGPGAADLTISGNSSSAIFDLSSGFDATISGLTLSSGLGSLGGAIQNKGGDMKLVDDVLSANQATDSGGAIYQRRGTLTLSGCSVTDNQASTGPAGGLYVRGGQVTVNDSTFSDNTTPYDGGAIAVLGGSLAISNSTLSNNTADRDGGGLCINGGSGVTLTNSTIADNTALRYGGGVCVDFGYVASIINCTLAYNNASDGGGFYTSNEVSSVTMGNSVVAENTASVYGPDYYGLLGTDLGSNLVGNATGPAGGFNQSTDQFSVNPLLGTLGNYGGPTDTIPLQPGSPAIDTGTNSVVPSGVATDQRGYARFAGGTTDIGAFELQFFLVTNNNDSGGGSLRTAIGIANSVGASEILFTVTGTITLQSALPAITNEVYIEGPGANVLAVSGGSEVEPFSIDAGVSATISGLTIEDGFDSGSGGGIANSGTLILQQCAVVNNSCGNLDQGGGGIYNAASSTLTFLDSTISGNSTTDDGGGISNFGTLYVVNSTVANNSANSFDGGGIYNAGTMTLTDSTMAGNSASSGGGILNVGTVTLGNTIVADNTITTGNGPDYYGVVTNDSGGNLIGNDTDTGDLTSLSDQVNLDPLLAPLGNYGGTTQTMPLLPGSPAIDAGNNALATFNSVALATDQRGLTRIVNGTVDIGAVECQGYTVTVVAGNEQSATVGANFSNSLVVLVTSSHGDPVSGGYVTFTPPGSGASAVFPGGSNQATINSFGLASIAVAANNVSGNYSVSSSTSGTSTPGSFSLTNTSGAATHLGFLQQPTNTVYGNTINPAVTVEVLDSNGNLVSTTASIIIALDTNPTSAVLGGTLQVNAVGGVATFDTLTLNLVGTGYTLEATSTGLAPASASNGFSITQRPITITAAANTKIYDATTSAAAIPTITSGSLASGETAEFTEAYSSPNAGTGLTLTPSGVVNDGNSGQNYSYTFVPVSAGVITAEALTIAAVTNSKTYDATTTAAAVPIITSGSLQGSDTANFIETYGSPNAGTGLTLTPSGVVNDCNSGQNYSYTFVPVSTGVITAAPLTITAAANTKVYDTTATAAATPIVTGLQGTDTVTNLSETYSSKNAGIGKTLVVATYTVNDGNGGNNYAVTTVSNNTGVITAVPLTITAVPNTKIYDGTTSAAAIPVVSGLQGADAVTNLSEVYNSPTIGTGKTLTVATYTINDGNGGNNYNVTTVPNETGVILTPVPTGLEIQIQPSATATAGQPFATQPVVYVLNQDGQLDTSDNTTPVTASLRVGTGPLLGTKTVIASGGIATFTNLQDNTAGKIVLVFTAPTVTKAQANPTTVSPAAASKFTITAPETATAGRPFTITVTAYDPYNNVATGYRRTVTFTSSDRVATVPFNYTFTSGDSGIHTFGKSVTLRTPGMQAVIIYDASNRSITGTASVSVGPNTGPNLLGASGGGRFAALVVGESARTPAPHATIASVRAELSKPAAALAGRRRTAGQADVARERVLAELNGNLHAYLMAERFDGRRSE
jgi:hypothetical protein